MHPKTRAALEDRRTRENPETVQQQLSRILATLPTGLDQQSLPDDNRTTTLITCTLNELHDLVHAGASEYLHSLSAMRVEQARQHATRIADAVVRSTDGSDYTHPGRDPRG